MSVFASLSHSSASCSPCSPTLERESGAAARSGVLREHFVSQLCTPIFKHSGLAHGITLPVSGITGHFRHWDGVVHMKWAMCAGQPSTPLLIPPQGQGLTVFCDPSYDYVLEGGIRFWRPGEALGNSLRYPCWRTAYPSRAR
jgi:hypothetical protein